MIAYHLIFQTDGKKTLLFEINPVFRQNGPQFGYLLSAKQKTDAGNYDISLFFDKKWDLDAQMGFSYSINDKLALNIFYAYGFLNVHSDFYLPDPEGMLGFRREAYSRGFYFKINYIFKK